jgi:hypothetical protein
MRKSDKRIGLLIETHELETPDYLLHKENKKIVTTNA